MPRSLRPARARIARQVALLLLASASAVAAQAPRADSAQRPLRTITGHVADGAGHGIAAAEVRAGTSTATLTDSTGRFVLRGVPMSGLQLVGRKVGYDSASIAVPAADSTTAAAVVVVAAIVFERTHRLTDIVVEGRAYDRALWDRGFYHRQKVASGMFFDTDAIQHFGGNGLGSLVRQVPRVDVRNIGNQDYAFSSIAGRPCRMNIYIDGMFQHVAMPGSSRARDGNAAEGLGLKELIDMRDIAAVEVYPRASAVPIQFQRMGPAAGPPGLSSQQIGSPNGLSRVASSAENGDAACGAIVIWTKPPGS